jgi:uncharacterized damage-inducible protein DinB
LRFLAIFAVKIFFRLLHEHNFMSQVEMIADQLRRAFDGEAWHGPAFMEILEGIDARTAAARPIPTAHSIWELVLHLAGWERVITRRLRGEKLTLSDEENFGHITSVSENAWREAVKTLRENHDELIKSVSSLPESKLSETVPGKEYNVLFMLLGAVQHAAYHGGQIALLKRSRS